MVLTITVRLKTACSCPCGVVIKRNKSHLQSCHLDGMCLSVYSCIDWVTPSVQLGNSTTKTVTVKYLLLDLSLTLTLSLLPWYNCNGWLCIQHQVTFSPPPPPQPPSVSLPIYQSIVILMECVGQCTVAYTGQPPVFSWGILQQRL